MSDATPWQPAVALAIGAHADDIEFGCGATLAKWSAAGAVVHLCVMTDGSKGTWDADAKPGDLVGLRRTEQRRAAAALGAREVHFFDFVDGELEVGRKEQAAVCELIRTVRPDTVLTHDPWKRYRLHPDHRAAGDIVLEGIVAARDPHFFPGVGGAPHRPERLLLFEAEVVDHVEAVDDSDLEHKIQALLSHESQWHNTLHIDAGTPQEEAQRAAFEARIRRDTERGEGFKLLTDL